MFLSLKQVSTPLAKFVGTFAGVARGVILPEQAKLAALRLALDEPARASPLVDGVGLLNNYDGPARGIHPSHINMAGKQPTLAMLQAPDPEAHTTPPTPATGQAPRVAQTITR